MTPQAGAKTVGFEGTFVDFSAKEINVQIRIVSLRGCRAKEIADYIEGQVTARPEQEPELSDIVGASSYSFIPDKLGLIRDFAVRIRVGVSCAGADISDAVLGASAIVLVTSQTEARTSIDKIFESTSYFAGTPIVVIADDDAKASIGIAPDPRAPTVIRTTPGATTEYFPALKAALKLALEQLKNDSTRAEPSALVSVAIPSMLETLRARQRKLGRPLTRDEVTAVRDAARFIMLSPERAAELDKKRGYRDLAVDDVWRDWNARSNQP